MRLRLPAMVGGLRLIWIESPYFYYSEAGSANRHIYLVSFVRDRGFLT
jgi:hypothetical protein